MSGSTASAINATPFAITRTFDAPRDVMWKAWTERERLRQWMGPTGFTMPSCTLDFRPGGLFHYCLTTPQGQEMWGKWTYREIVKPERLTYVVSFSDPDRGVTRHPFSADWPLEMLSSTTFAEANGKTALTVEWAPSNPTPAERKCFDDSHAGMTAGWGGTFDQLAAYLAKS